MASRPVSSEYLKAGQDYLDALVALGLTPAYLGWGWDKAHERWLLVLFTSLVDAGAPLALNDLLFRAYNAKATPKEISPFIVRVFSPKLLAGGQESMFWILGSSKDELYGEVDVGEGKYKKMISPGAIENFSHTFMGIDFEMINSYRTLPGAVQKANAGYHAQKKDWQRFKSRVERLAA